MLKIKLYSKTEMLDLSALGLKEIVYSDKLPF